MKDCLKAISRNSSEIFFLNHPLAGAGIFAITLMNPNVSIAGTIALLSAYLFARALKSQKRFLDSGFYTFNPLLVGFSIGYLFQLTFLTVSIVAGLGILTYLLTGFLYNLFSFYLRLPILSLPFAIVSSSIYVASAKVPAPFAASLYHQASSALDGLIPLPVWGYLKTMGGILFIPEVSAGIAFALLTFIISRILFFLTLLGYFTGTLVTGFVTGSFEQVFLSLNQFNCILIAVAVGGVFLVPSPRSYLLAVCAVVCLTLLMHGLQSFWAMYRITVFSLPYNVICLSFVYILGVINYPLIARFIRSTPEETLDHYLSALRGGGRHGRPVALPFSGSWTVWQGFNGRWTHKGFHRHACDFLITGAEGRTFRSYGKQLSDYYAFGKPVLSPVRGRVVHTVGSLPDNPIGKPDHVNRWGNFVMIQDPRGFFVELSHFAKDSIQVKEGDWVEPGRLLGRCGNSGNSPQPHIHIQVQGDARMGSQTLPFCFTGYNRGKTFHANELPVENEVVAPFRPDDLLERKTAFAPGDTLHYEIYESGRKTGSVRWVVREDPDKSLYFDSGNGKLYFGRRDGVFRITQVEGADLSLHLLALALPRMFLVRVTQPRWQDRIPVDILIPGLPKTVLLFLSSFYHGLHFAHASYRCLDRNRIAGTIRSGFWRIHKSTCLELDEEAGFKSIVVDHLELRKINTVSASIQTSGYFASHPGSPDIA